MGPEPFSPHLIRVSPGDLHVSWRESEVLCALGVGTGVAIVIHDPYAAVGGLAHVLRPGSAHRASAPAELRWGDAERAIPELIERALFLGAERGRLRTAVVGGAEFKSPGYSRANIAAAKALLVAQGLVLNVERTGGNDWRAVTLALGSGVLTIEGLDEREEHALELDSSAKISGVRAS